MTYDPNDEPKTTAGNTAGGDYSWSEPEGENGNARAREWIAQLQAMIENLATQAAPVVREVGAKAAELAALAGEKAGPVAQRAAVLTGQAGQKLAERSRELATELRRDAAAQKSTTEIASSAESTADETAGIEPPTTAGVP